ncbi:MAG TPA: hypothetical protein VGF92_05420 [Stellaceae bacterium]|jgi:hypothetical protein
MDESADTLDLGSDPLDVFSQGGSGTVDTPADNPSNGIDLNSLLGNLTGAATTAFTAAQNSAAAQSIAQAQIAASAASPGNPLAILSTVNPTYLWIGAGIIVLALILRK